jgi:hypothetical protein
MQKEVAMQEVESGDLGKILDRFEDDTLFIDANRHKWVEELAGHWVVVYDGELVSHAEALDTALAEARSKGVSGDVAVDRITSEPHAMIL